MTLPGSTSAKSFALTAFSAAAHLVVFTLLGLVPAPRDVIAMREMEMVIAEVEPEAPPEPPPEPPPAEEPPPPEPERAPPRAAAAPEPPPPAEEAPPPSEAAEEVADFTGVTMTGEGSSSWSTVVGSGAPLQGPVGKIGRKQGDGSQIAAKPAPATATGPRVVALKNLARRPGAPSGLDSLLEQHYPRRARAQGIEGKVVMAVRVLPTGRLTGIRLVREWPAGFDFADACRKLLKDAPAFVPPLDRDGSPVAADIDFTCDFVVDY